jgi:hypothetical protein
MLSDFTSGQPDSKQCRHCGVTLAARLLSCPSCGANQDDSPGWYPPMIASASARLPAPSSSVQPHLAAPAAWDTAAGVAEDQFYAKHDPWSEPKRSSKVWLVVAALLLLIAVATGGYLLLRPDLYASHTVAKASYGAVTTQEAAQPAGPAVAMASKDAMTTGASKSVASMSSGARQVGAPKAGAPSKLVEAAPAEVRQAETKQVVGKQTEAKQLEAKQAETKLTEAKQAEAKQAEAKQAAALKRVEVKPVAAPPTAPTLAASKPDVQILAAQTLTDSPATGPAPVISKPAPLETHSATTKPAVSNQPSISASAAASSSLSVAPRSMAASPASAPTTALASNQPGAITGSAITNRSNAKSASAIANAASGTAATSASKPLSAPGNPIASNKPGVALQSAALKPKETSTIASHGSASETPLTPASKRDTKTSDAKTSDAKANETKTSAAKSATDQASRDATKNLQMAQAMLARDDLSAARSHLSKVLAAQPKNRDAQGLDATLSAREQQRDAVLQTARNCESSGRWICAWHNAGSAIVIDSGSADARRILSHAMNEAEASKAPPGAPAVESQRTLPDHH